MKEITFEEAKKVIEEWGIDTDNFACVNVEYSMNGGDPTDNSIELAHYHQKCLKVVVDVGLKANPIERRVMPKFADVKQMALQELELQDTKDDIANEDIDRQDLWRSAFECGMVNLMEKLDNKFWA